MSLPPEVSSQLFKELGPEEVQAITLEISQLPQIAPDVRAQVIDEFLQSSSQSSSTSTAPQSHTRHTAYSPSFRGEGGGIHSSVMGAPSATASPPSPTNRPLGFLRRIDPRQLIHLIRKEHPQTIAVVLSYLDHNQASAVLSELSPTSQTEVARRLAELGKINEEIIQELENILEARLQKALEEGFDSPTDGKDTLLRILNQADRNTEEKILTGLTQKSPHLASDIKTKLCDFEDLNNVDDASLQQVLRLTDFRDLVLAMKGANRELTERIYKFLSPEVARALRGDVESLGQVSWEEIKGAQQQIRNILRGLVTLGKIRFK